MNETTSFVYLKRNFYELCLEAFREIGTMFVSLDLLGQTNIIQTVTPFRYYPTTDVAEYAKHVCQKWAREIEKHKQTMTDQKMLIDPLEAVYHLL